MLKALGLCCMDLSSRCGHWAELVAQGFHFQKCTTLNTEGLILMSFAIGIRRNANVQSDSNTAFRIVEYGLYQIVNSA